MANDVILDLGNEYIGSAYSPVVEITENEDGHTISITSADPDAAGHLVTQSFDVPNYASEEEGREAAETMREAYEAQRQAAEDARKAAETARQGAESSRASAETAREIAENIRRGQEQGRQQAEQYRQLNEATRQQEEQARQDAEVARYEAEQARSAAETAREAAESERQLAEQAREDAEDARQAAEQAREMASATAVANAEAATFAAQAATTAANAAAETATTAAGTANTAAQTANTAADAADTAREGIQDDLDQMRSDIADKAFVDAYVPLLTAGAAHGITGNGPTDSAAWLQRVSTSDGPTTIRSIHGNTIVQDGELVPVNMTGIETTGFNQWDEQWEVGYFYDNNGTLVYRENSTTTIRSKNFIPVIAGETYYTVHPAGTSVRRIAYFDASKQYIGIYEPTSNFVTIPSGASYIKFHTENYGTTYKHDICINLSDPTRNGEYKPYWQQERSIPAGTLRGAGTVYDELTETERITRVYHVADVSTLALNSFNADSHYVTYVLPVTGVNKATGRINVTCSKFAGATALTDGGCYVTNNGVTALFCNYSWTTREEAEAYMAGVEFDYELATYTVTPIDPPLNMTYRTEQGGTERVMVPTGEQSAPPTIVAAQGYTAESLRDAALSAIAPIENGLASTNYAVGSYLVHDGQLCKVTTAIASGEAITIGTNVVTTTVMAEVIALTQ